MEDAISAVIPTSTLHVHSDLDSQRHRPKFGVRSLTLCIQARSMLVKPAK